METPGVAGGYDTYPLRWKFQGGGGSEAKGPSMGRGVWIFSGTTQYKVGIFQEGVGCVQVLHGAQAVA